jgi:hypothetical protein
MVKEEGEKEGGGGKSGRRSGARTDFVFCVAFECENLSKNNICLEESQQFLQ